MITLPEKPFMAKNVPVAIASLYFIWRMLLAFCKYPSDSFPSWPKARMVRMLLNFSCAESFALARTSCTDFEIFFIYLPKPTANKATGGTTLLFKTHYLFSLEKIQLKLNFSKPETDYRQIRWQVKHHTHASNNLNCRS
jgi:hypothetical protein